MKQHSLVSGNSKDPFVVLAPVFVMATFTVFIFAPWVRRVDLHDTYLSLACLINGAIWWATLYWSFHHLCFRLFPMLVAPRDSAERPNAVDTDTIRFAILYATCDDFQWSAAHSCLTLDYPAECLTVVICDDSRNVDYRRRIDEFKEHFPLVQVVRRETRQGYKAGNLNHALNHTDLAADWVLILDADQVLPQRYLLEFNEFLQQAPGNVAYVQAKQLSDHALLGNNTTKFQEALGHEIDVFYSQDLALRTDFGFLPLIGHGAAIRLSALNEVPFPEVVSEDFALSMELRNRKWIGIYAPEVTSYESFPESFSAFVIRFRKFAGGTAELIREHLGRFLVGPATFTEKLDFSMMVSWYVLMPLIVFNGYLSGYVCHRLWSLRISALHPVLPYLFALMFLIHIPALYASTPSFWTAVQHFFWSSAIYSAALPVASVRFLRYIFTGQRPTFERTPKGAMEPRLGVLMIVGMFLLGCVTLAWATLLYSPFSPVLYGLGVSYVCFPLYRKLNEDKVIGVLARMVIWLPGICYMWALWSMWKWQGI